MDITLLIVAVITAVWTVMARSLLKAAIALAITSVVISVIIFRLDSPLAAVFELSVCAGLITAVFVSTISMVKPLSNKDIAALTITRLKRYIYLPVILLVAGALLIMLKVPRDFILIPQPQTQVDVRTMMWDFRGLDLLGQVVILIAGALGIVILFGENKKDG